MAEVLIQGVLRDEATGGPGAALHVEAWDDRHGTTRPLGRRSATSGALLSPSRSTRRCGTVSPRRARRCTSSSASPIARGAPTRRPGRVGQREPKEMVIAVDLRDGDGDDGFEVRGRVVTDRGTPAPGLLVRAVDRRLRGEAPLGEAVTGPRGDYAIAWSLGQLGGKRLADLEVRAFGQDRTGGGRRRAGKELARSSTAYQAPRRHVVDLQVAFDAVDRDSEHDRLLQSLAGLLGEVPLAEVDPNGVMYLAEPGRMGPPHRGHGGAGGAGRGGVGHPRRALLRRVPDRGGGRARRRAPSHRRAPRPGDRGCAAAGPHRDRHPLDATLERHRGEATTRLRSFVPSGAVSSVDDLLSVRLDEERTRGLRRPPPLRRRPSGRRCGTGCGRRASSPSWSSGCRPTASSAS